MADRKASARWEGDLFSGGGTVSAGSSGLFVNAPVTWASRTAEPGGLTSPEELIAAAHAACFSMALSNELAAAGHAPTAVTVDATSTFEKGTITTMVLVVRADVPGLSDQEFRPVLAAAEQGCPVSKALRDGVDIQVQGTLA